MIRTAWHDLLTGHRFAGPALAGPPGQTAARSAVGLKAAPAGHWLTWRRLPPALELVTLGAGYAAPSLVRLALPAAKHAAFAHAAGCSAPSRPAVRPSAAQRANPAGSRR